MTERDEVLKHVQPDKEPEGEFVPDFENEPYKEQTYNGEFSLINLGPAKVAELQKKVDAGEEVDVDKEALQIAQRFWRMHAAKAGVSAEAGEPERGEPLPAKHVDSLAECVGGERAEYIGPIEPLPSAGKSAEGGLIDFDFLQQEEP